MVGKAKPFKESEMALFSECMQRSAKKGIDSGGVVRDACYTLVDGYSVKILLLSPMLVEYAGNLFRALVLSGGAWQERTSLLAEWRRCWKEALGVEVLTPVA